MDTMVEEMCEQYKIKVPWGGAVMQMLCHNEYIFWGRRWGAETSGCCLLRSTVMRCEFLLVMKMRVLKVCDERGEGREVHGDATNGRKDSGVFVGGEPDWQGQRQSMHLSRSPRAEVPDWGTI